MNCIANAKIIGLRLSVGSLKPLISAREPNLQCPITKLNRKDNII